ncbi:hypothetical protein Tco_0433282 [Tanacetum coccineum]
MGAKLAQPSLNIPFSKNRGWKWDLESSEDFSVVSVRKIIDDKSLSDVDSKTRWIKYVPIKVNVHSGSGETSRHLFFYCCMVRQIVRKITRWWDVPYVEVESYEDWYRRNASFSWYDWVKNPNLVTV